MFFPYYHVKKYDKKLATKDLLPAKYPYFKVPKFAKECFTGDRS
jgi:hypothetical protein